MRAKNIITLLTDFGEVDGFVGVMKGVMLNILPRAVIIDMTHQVPAHDIDAGAFILNSSFHYFPAGTVHVAIVDPGVGGKRRALAVQTANYFFIAPDNGILKFIFEHERPLRVFALANEKYFLRHISNTFHGRDIFAPCAAHLCAGVKIDEFGPEIFDYQTGEIQQPLVGIGQIIGNIIYVDTFGNLITNIPGAMVLHQSIEIGLGTSIISSISRSYDEQEHEPLALIGSAGFLEIAIFRQNASQRLNVRVGDAVSVKFIN